MVFLGSSTRICSCVSFYHRKKCHDVKSPNIKPKVTGKKINKKFLNSIFGNYFNMHKMCGCSEKKKYVASKEMKRQELGHQEISHN